MKTIISIVLIIALILIIILGVRIYNQNKKLDTIEKAELSEITNQSEVSVASNTTTITKTSSGLSQSGEMTIDEENTYLRFTGFGPGKEHSGSFDTMTANISFDNGSVSGGSLLIETASVNTGIKGLDSHLNTDDFLDTINHPQIEFILVDVTVNDEDQSAVANGELTVRGITKKISVPVTLLANGFSADFLLDTSLFGISYIGVNEEVQIESQVIWK